jgi:hypothetical protein
LSTTLVCQKSETESETLWVLHFELWI